jgi:hypothetical protein
MKFAMPGTDTPSLDAGFHLRVPSGFTEQVHSAARHRNMTASAFVRWAVMQAAREAPAPDSASLNKREKTVK